MPQCHWLLEDDVFEENLEPLMHALRAQSIPFEIMRHVPFSEVGFDGYFPDDACVVAYGSLQLIEQVRRSAAWRPGCYGTLPRYYCTQYYPVYGKHLLNSPYIMLPYGELLRQRDFLLGTLGNSGCLFVRPDSVAKLFAGQVIAGESYERDVERLGFYDVTPETLVVVAEPQNIAREWRVVVVAGKPVAASLYREHGRRVQQAGAPSEVFDWCRELLATPWQPDPCWTLDVCQLPSGELKLLEIGTFSSAGLYACDPTAVVTAVSQQAIRDWEAVIG